MRTFTDFKLLLIVFVSFIFVNCNSEDVVDDIPNEEANKDIIGASVGKYQQLNFEEAIGFVNEIKPEKPLKGGSGLGTLNANSDFLVGIDANSLVFEDVENTAHKIPTLKAHLKSPEVESTAFLVKVQDSVLGFLMNKVEEKSIDDKHFSGIIGITDLSGNFVNGYRLKNGEFVSRFVVSKNQKSRDSANASKNTLPFTTLTVPKKKWMSGTIRLEEVSVYAPEDPSSSGGGSYFGGLRMGGSSYRSFSFSFSFGGPNSGGGGGGSGSNGGSSGGGAVEVFPCDDPLHGCDNNFAEEEVENKPPDCDSFEYFRVGGNNWQTAGVSGVHELFTVFNWECVGYDWGVFTQPLYFQLPINIKHPFNSGLTKTESAAYLHLAFKAFDIWYQRNGCNSGGAAMEQKLLEYIKDEFKENGGNVTLKPPLGFIGEVKPYKVSWVGYGNCN